MTQHTATLLDDAVEPRDILGKPGIYVAPSSSPAYGVLEALLVADKAQDVGETQLEDGRHARAVRIASSRANATQVITIGSDFFAGAKRDYANWKEKWWREAIQNSVDAGATRVVCAVEYLDDKGNTVTGNDQYQSVVISVEDDGRGMNRETLLDKFLVLGGSGKRSDTGAVGGFGKAKELLLLPWMRWGIETQALRVSGHGIQYEVEDVPMRQGTRIVVQMAADDHTNAAAAIAFIGKCYLPNVDFRVVDGKNAPQKVPARLKVGELARELPGANVYYEKRQRLDAPVMLIRVNGIYMHQRWVADGVLGTIIVELTGRSVDLLAANRDSVRDYLLARALDKYINELAADVKSATRSRKQIRQKFEGTGKYEVRARRATALATVGDLEPVKGKLPPKQVEQLQEILVEQVLQASPVVAEEDDGPLVLTTGAATLQACADIKLLGAKHVETMIKQLSTEPDFFVVNEDADFHVAKKYLPGSMAAGFRKLAKFWAEMCRFVLIQLNYDGDFGVGWIFDEETGAMYLPEQGEHWLLLNPFKLTKRLPGSKRLGGQAFSLSDPDDVNWLYAAAVHEVTHLADGITNHDESFASALTRNVARTANRGAQIEKIRKATVARPKKAARPTPSELAFQRQVDVAKTRIEQRQHVLNHWLFERRKREPKVLEKWPPNNEGNSVVFLRYMDEGSYGGYPNVYVYVVRSTGVDELHRTDAEWSKAISRSTELEREQAAR